MSRDVSMRGKLIPIDLGLLSLEEKAYELIPSSQWDSIDSYDSAVQYLTLEIEGYHYDEASGVLFEISKQDLEEGSFISLTRNKDGSFDFYTQFYNGGTCLSEMLDEGFDSLG